MIKINLLPAEIVAERRRKSLQNRWLMAVFSLALVLLFICGGLYYLAQETAAEIAVVQQQRRAVEQEAEKYGSLQELKQSVNAKKDLLTAAMGAEFGWRETLAALGAKIPADVWLTNLELVFDGEQGLLTLRGLTYNHPATARWAEALASAADISAVRISFSAVETNEDNELVRFELRAQVSPGELYQPPGGSEE